VSDDKDKGAEGAQSGDGQQQSGSTPPTANDSPAAKADAAEAAPPAPSAKAPAWQARDYDGPITGEQAAWRNANIKPHAPAASKPAGKASTK
jgi:hypothetical protein